MSAFVPPAPKPHPRNVQGPFFVEEGCCTLCGVPEAEAPNLFGIDTDADGYGHCFVARQPVTAEERRRMLRVVTLAELRCVFYRGDDPAVRRVMAEAGDGDRCVPPVPEVAAPLLPGAVRESFWRPGALSVTFNGRTAVRVRVRPGGTAEWEDDGEVCSFHFDDRTVRRAGAVAAELPRRAWWGDRRTGPEPDGAWGPNDRLRLRRSADGVTVARTGGTTALEAGPEFSGWRAALLGPRRFRAAADLDADERAACTALLADLCVTFRG